MNTSLIQDENFNLLLKEDIKSFFEINAGSTDTKAMEWEVSKTYIRGKIIAHSSKKKKVNMKKIMELEKAIKDQEMELTKHFSDKLYQHVCKLKFQLQDIYNKKVANMLYLGLGQHFMKEERKQASYWLDN